MACWAHSAILQEVPCVILSISAEQVIRVVPGAPAVPAVPLVQAAVAVAGPQAWAAVEPVGEREGGQSAAQKNRVFCHKTGPVRSLVLSAGKTHQQASLWLVEPSEQRSIPAFGLLYEPFRDQNEKNGCKCDHCAAPQQKSFVHLNTIVP